MSRRDASWYISVACFALAFLILFYWMGLL